jgi:Phage capsid family
MNLSEQIQAFQLKRNELAEANRKLMEAAAAEDRTLDDEEQKTYDHNRTELKTVDQHLDRLREVEGQTAADANTTQVRSNGYGTHIITKEADPDDKFKGQSFTRCVIAKALSQIDGHEQSPAEIAKHRWGRTHKTLVRLLETGGFQKSNEVQVGGSIADRWGNELVSADSRYTGDFQEYLAGMTVFDRLPLVEVPANITIKGQDAIATANWVGEHDAIPVSAQSFTDVSLRPLKISAISACSRELLRDSSPAAEALVQRGLGEASSQKVDTTFLGSAAAVANVSPAGILVGVSTLGSNGYTADALRADIKELRAPFLSAKNAGGMWLIMTPALGSAIQLMVNALGVLEFPQISDVGGALLGHTVLTGDNVGATTIIMLKPSEIYRIGNTGIQVSMSLDATIEMSSVPAGFAASPMVAASANLQSMFQSESVAFKVVRPINFAKRRSHAAQFISDAAYGDSTSTTA